MILRAHAGSMDTESPEVKKNLASRHSDSIAATNMFFQEAPVGVIGLYLYCLGLSGQETGGRFVQRKNLKDSDPSSIGPLDIGT